MYKNAKNTNQVFIQKNNDAMRSRVPLKSIYGEKNVTLVVYKNSEELCTHVALDLNDRKIKLCVENLCEILTRKSPPDSPLESSPTRKLVKRIVYESFVRNDSFLINCAYREATHYVIEDSIGDKVIFSYELPLILNLEALNNDVYKTILETMRSSTSEPSK